MNVCCFKPYSFVDLVKTPPCEDLLEEAAELDKLSKEVDSLKLVLEDLKIRLDKLILKKKLDSGEL